MVTDDALEASEVVDVGHGPHHEVVGGEDQAAPVALHSEYPEEVVGVKGRNFLRNLYSNI